MLLSRANASRHLAPIDHSQTLWVHHCWYSENFNIANPKNQSHIAVCKILSSLQYDHFDFSAPFYDQLARLPDRNRFQRLLKLPYDGRLLDAGAGTARISSTLSGMIGQVVVSDLLRF